MHSSQLANRSENLILFEVSLLATKSDLDEVFKHLIGRSVEVLDAFRLGRKPSLSSAAVDPSTPPNTRPRPLLIKCANAWDRRLLLASRRKLKDFTKYKLFLHEDLPPDEHHTVSALLVLMALSITLILLLFLLRLLPLIPPTLLQFLVLIVFQFFRFTPVLLWLLPIRHVSALIIVVGGILVNNVSELLKLHDLCLIQEHWLFNDHLNSQNFSNDVLSVTVSGMDDTDLIWLPLWLNF